jgi:osmotically inducible lipoprotein OsmB
MEVNTTGQLIDVGHSILEGVEIKKRMTTAVVALCILSLTACGTIVGGAVGAGSGAAIGAGTGYGAKKGALIGGGAGAAAGAVYDILR